MKLTIDELKHIQTALREKMNDPLRNYRDIPSWEFQILGKVVKELEKHNES